MPDHVPQQSELPLGTLLSYTLIAFTIELDNEFERSLIEPTGETFSTWKREVFLVSLPMWTNYLRCLADGEKTVAELASFACRDDAAVKSALNGFTRWRHVTVEPPSSPTKRKPPFHDWLVRPTPAGEKCLRIWQPLPELIEGRWRSRYGDAAVDRLRKQLAHVVRQRSVGGPQHLPLVSSRREMFSHIEADPSTRPDPDGEPLFALLSRALLAYTLDFEAESPFALPLCANALRVVDDAGTAIRDIPRRSGISKEGIAQALTLLRRHQLATVEPVPEGRGKQARLTERGVAAKTAYLDRRRLIEERWEAEFGPTLAESLRGLVVSRRLGDSPLAAAYAPPSCTWRAERELPEFLPDHPMTLGRGGWPDAS